MKNLYFGQIRLSLLTAALCLLGTIAQASETYRWPEFCDQTTLTVTNNKSQTIQLWLQERSPYLQSETEIKLSAFESKSIVLNTQNQSYSLLNTSENQILLNRDFKISITCNDESAVKSLPVQTSEGGIHFFKITQTTQKKVSLFLKNLHIDKNQFLITELDRFQKVVKQHSFVLTNLETQKKSIELQTKTAWVKVSADYKFLTYSLQSQQVKFADSIRPQVVPVETDGSYFLVGRKNNQSESFVVKISDSALLEKARDQIKNPRNEKIIFGTVVLGHNNTNRDFSKKDKSFWSWSVGEVTNITDIAATWCNGTPQLVEDVLVDWLNNPGKICFWNYRLLKELSPKEVSTGQLSKY